MVLFLTAPPKLTMVPLDRNPGTAAPDTDLSAAVRVAVSAVLTLTRLAAMSRVSEIIMIWRGG